MAKVHFNKTYKNPDELVRLLQSRGLNIMDKNRAERYIESIGYYRLSAYMYPLLEIPKSNHLFKNGTAFDKVIMLYRFDKKLRILLFNEIEKIEVAVREAVMNLTAERTGDMFWLTNPVHFHDQTIYGNSMNLLKKEYDRSTEDFIEHFKQTYTEQFPPAWILGELLPMGSVNIYYRNLKDKTLKKHIAKRFYLHAPVFESWLSVLTLTRNACCHHSRVWNKVNKIIPNDMRGMTRPWITLPSDKRKIYYNICIIKYFLDVISPNNDLLAKLRWLFVDFPEIDLNALGFPKGWEMEPLWS
ncbi:MAG: Abi family protein [Bacteroidaceae bacterium]|nr:Abi family protein [Bacteroidaceae bacterium]